MDDLTRTSGCVVTRQPACDRRANESDSYEDAFVAAAAATVPKRHVQTIRYPKNAPPPRR